MSQQGTSRAAVERLLTQLAAAEDPNHAALVSQIRLHAELAGLTAADVAKLAEEVTKPAGQADAPAAKRPRPAPPVGD